LGDREPVVAVTIRGESRAYPVQILVWHEIVNDTIAGVPVAVSYCPLCNTALVYDRRVTGKVLDFGTSGELYNSDLVMYDRQTQSLWVQFLGEAVAGVLTGTRLADYPAQTVSWGDWQRAHPTSWVLSTDTGFVRPYGVNPYPGYDDIRGRPFLFDKPTDGRLPAMSRVVGLRQGDQAIAVTFAALARSPVIAVTLVGRPVVVWLRPGTVSPLDRDTVVSGREVGASGAFDPTVGGHVLRFESTAAGFRDRQTGTEWDVEGRAIQGPLTGQSLTPVTHVDTFWFVWAAFLPQTRIVIHP
jgi:hypothetical protein